MLNYTMGREENKAFRGYSLRWSLLLASFCFCSSLIKSQTIPEVKYKNTASLSQEMALLDLLKVMQQQTGFTFIFDEKILEELTFSFEGETRHRFNRFLLNEITRQTNLQFQAINKTTFVIKKKRREKVTLSGYCTDISGNPMEGANLCLAGENLGVISDAEGYFEMELKQGAYSLSVSYVGFESINRAVEISGYDDVELTFRFKKHLELEEILVVGNRFSPKSLQETAAPVEVVNEKQLNQANQADLSQLLQYETPSFHSTHQTVSDGTDHVDPISLKGLGPDQVLVLVNGKRRHSSSLVNVNGTVGRGSVGIDLNAIPITAIRKIEILKDGATALYGSDAIAGVINLLLKNTVDQGLVRIQTGITKAGDGQHLSVSTHYGLKSFKEGHTNLTFYVKRRTAVNRSGAYDGPIFGTSEDANEQVRESFFQQVGFGKNRVMEAGNSAILNTGFLLNMAAPLTGGFEFYTHGNFNYRQGDATGFYRFPYEESKQSGLYPLGFSPSIQSNIFDFSIVNGLKGKIDDWEIDFSNNLGQNSFGFNIANSNNASMGLQSPTSVYAGGFSYLQNLLGLDITKTKIFDLPINLAFGTEFRLEKYTQKEGAEPSWQDYGKLTRSGQPKEAGFQVFRGFRPENATKKFRNNIGFYGDIEVELTKKSLLGLAGRFEDYSDFGSNFSWKASYRYLISPTLTLRSTFNTGFRAPSLQQAYFSSHSLQFLPVGGEIMATEVAHANHESPIVRRLEIPNLKPEISNNVSIGLAAQPAKNLSFTIDAYQIAIKDRIVLSGNLEPKANDQLYAILSSSDISRIQFFTNAIDTKTTGLDAKLKYNRSFAQSRLDLLFGLHMNRTSVTKNVSPSDLLSDYVDAIFSREEVARLESGQPNSKLIFVANFQQKKWDFMFRATRFGRVIYMHPMDQDPSRWVLNQYTDQYESRDQLFNAKWICDVDVAMKVSPTLQLTLGLENLFDVYPNSHRHSANTNHGVLIYSRRVQQFGVQGRRWVLKAIYKLGD